MVMNPSTPTSPSDETPRKDTHVTKQDSPEGPGITSQNPDSMPRADDDKATRARSREFHDHPGSGRHTADGKDVY